MTTEQQQTETNTFNVIRKETIKALNSKQNKQNLFINISEKQLKKATIKNIKIAYNNILKDLKIDRL